ncbi:MAG: nlpD 1 [Gammaproteobacteria bacterium]|jgi:murein DD-endopeptidase MepM/ murein hydrolase activator NlpD|nr:nlpD 1 [Gammaproteobacteria bacterium]
MRNWQKASLLALSLLTLTACSQNWFAPSANLSGGNYTVKSGDTLNNIARKFNVSAQSIASYNNLTPPYQIRAGQTLIIKNLRGDQLPPAVPQPVNEPAPVSTNQVVSTPVAGQAAAPVVSAGANTPALSSTNTAEGVVWSWPAQGSLIGSNQAGVQQGINIAGTVGQPVYAAASGQVLFSGIGSSGYGNMIIIKHAYNFLTAYGNNQKLLVKEGQQVARGQQIATMGQAQQQAQVHFEIRKAGVVVNPLNYLPSK